MFNNPIAYRKKLDYYITKANFKKFTFHDLRHSYVSMLIDKGVDMFLIS